MVTLACNIRVVTIPIETKNLLKNHFELSKGK